VSIDRAREICSHGEQAAEADPYLRGQWRKHGNAFLAWWNRRPPASSEVDVAQFYEIARTTAASALEVLGAAEVVPLSSDQLRMPASNTNAAFAAAMNADLGEGIAYFELDHPQDIGAPDMDDCVMFGALGWKRENAGLNVIPFANQGGRDATFGHVLFDSSGSRATCEPLIAVHPGLTVVSLDGSVITPVEIDSPSICGAVVRAGAHMAHLVVGALWAREATRRPSG
jgi:hypothetical protein